MRDKKGCFLYRDIFIIILLIIISLFIYRNGIVGLPRSDHEDFLENRSFFKSDIDFFQSCISYSRSRRVSQGDYFLFRPGTHGLLAIMDIFLRANLYAIGILSIIWHGLVAAIVYFVTSRISGRRIALLAALFFVVQFAGMEMIMWRHTSPCVFSLIFFGLGLFYFLINDGLSSSKRAVFLISSCFLFSMFFHEIFAFALPISGLLIYAAILKKSNNAQRRVISIIFFLPAAVFFALNALDYIIYRPPFFIPPNELACLYSSTLYSIIKNFVHTVGIFTISFVNPSYVNLTDLCYKINWDVRNIPVYLVCAYAVVSTLAFVYLGFRLLKKFRRGFLITSDVALFIVIVSVGVLVGGLFFGRIQLRSFAYIIDSGTYYYYFFSFLLIIGSVSLFKIIEKKITGHLVKTVLASAFIVCIIYLTYINYSGIQKSLTEITPEINRMARITYRVSQITGRKPYCYGGAGNYDLSSLPSFNNNLLYPQSCAQRPGIPLYLMEDRNHQITLETLGPVDRPRISIRVD